MSSHEVYSLLRLKNSDILIQDGLVRDLKHVQALAFINGLT